MPQFCAEIGCVMVYKQYSKNLKSRKKNQKTYLHKFALRVVDD